MRRPARSGRSRFFRAWVHGLQSSFGIKPVNKLLGAIQVKDVVDVEFDLVATEAQPPPAPPASPASPAP